MNVRSILESLVELKSLDSNQAENLMSSVMLGEISESQIAALLIALRMKGESVDELIGFVKAMRSKMKYLDLSVDAVDLCGTGGDGWNTFNVSTTASFVVAGAGLKVAKHGNRSISSKSGSADVLQALQIPIDLDSNQVKNSIEKKGLGFLFAPNYHPAMKYVMPARNSLKIRTVFNLLGPLCNPCGVKRQVVGVFSKEWITPLAKVLGELGAEHVIVVHGSNGMDEFSMSSTSHYAEWRHGELNVGELNPEALGLELCSEEIFIGGDAHHNAQITIEILQGVEGPKRNMVLLNAAAAIRVGSDLSWSDALQKAAYSIDSGSAMTVLENLRGN